MNCEDASSWKNSIDVENKTISLFKDNQTSLNSEILDLRNNASQKKNQSQEKIQEISKKIDALKSDIRSIKKINREFLKFCLGNNSFIQEKKMSFSTQTQKFIDLALESLVQIKSPEETNKTTENMFLKQNEVFQKVLKLLKALKKNLVEGIENLKNQSKQEKLQLTSDLQSFDDKIQLKQQEINDLQNKIDESQSKINDLVTKNKNCESGTIVYNKCVQQKAENQKFIENLLEEQQLIDNLMDLVGKLT